MARTATDIRLPDMTTTTLRALIESGEDPRVGFFHPAVCRREACARRDLHPAPIVRNMVEWPQAREHPPGH